MERAPLRPRANPDALVLLWTVDETDWIMAPRSAAPDDVIRWAGKAYRVVRRDGERRVKLMRTT